MATYRAFQAYSIAKHFGIPFHRFPELIDGLNEHVVPRADDGRQWAAIPPTIEASADADDETQLLCAAGFLGGGGQRPRRRLRGFVTWHRLRSHSSNVLRSTIDGAAPRSLPDARISHHAPGNRTSRTRPCAVVRVRAAHHLHERLDAGSRRSTARPRSSPSARVIVSTGDRGVHLVPTYGAQSNMSQTKTSPSDLEKYLIKRIFGMESRRTCHSVAVADQTTAIRLCPPAPRTAGSVDSWHPPSGPRSPGGRRRARHVEPARSAHCSHPGSGNARERMS
ncbi:hypothetical protein SAMN05880568_2010 [Microbacterium sp. RURRCA19A]|nr:hypothetical protein SAMN05880568_2010 [Microbacterium sp. RURRCA19A]